MIKDIYETKMKKVKVDEEIYCDVCKKKINAKKGYYSLVIGHNDWGMIVAIALNSLNYVPKSV